MCERATLTGELLEAARLELSTLLANPLARHMATAPFVLAAIAVVLTPRIDHGFAATLVLLFAIVAIGLCAVHLTARRTKDPRVAWLGDLFLAKLVVAMFVLFQGWTPQLDRLSESFGYDPQRYYFDAQDWVAAGYALDAIPGLNYTGIVVYYGAVFTAFGHNPVAPALTNLLLSLLTALLVVRTAHWVTVGEPRALWLVGAFIVLPEILWYDVLTSREIPAMALVTTVTLVGTRPLVGAAATGAATAWAVMVAAVALLTLGITRTAMVIPAAVSIGLFALRGPVWKRHGGKTLALAAAGLVGAVAAPVISQRLGSTTFGYDAALRAILDQKAMALVTYQWTDRSFGQFLIPDTAIGAVLLAPARVLLYLVAPWPAGLVSAADLADGYWDAWQRLAAGTSAIVYVALFPCALASAATLLRDRRWARGLVFHVPMWVSLIAVAAGNIVISERYRVMVVPLLWACIWLGFASPPRMLRRAYVAWAIVLSGFAASFLAFKAGLIG